VVRRRGPPPLLPLQHQLVEEEEEDEQFNIHASETDGYDSEFDKECQNDDKSANKKPDELPSDGKEIDYNALKFFEEEGEKGPAINEDFATILRTNWKVPKNLTQLKTLFTKYQSPENCVFEPPKINEDMRYLINSAGRTLDMQLLGVQKSMAKTMNASILILEEAIKATPDMQKIAQTTTDISAMLGHASYDVSKKRRSFFYKTLKPKYKPLCYEKEADGLLFGKDIPAKIKDLNLRHQLKDFDYSNYLGNAQSTQVSGRRGGNKNWKNYRTYPNNRGSFLPRGRGNLPARGTRGKRGRGSHNSAKNNQAPQNQQYNYYPNNQYQQQYYQ